jgi:DNA polymerase I-like protein with 3'-5' exonuclease and polymerase domains
MAKEKCLFNRALDKAMGLQDLDKAMGLQGLDKDSLLDKWLSEKQSCPIDFTDKLQGIQCTTVPGRLWGWPRDADVSGVRDTVGTYRGIPDHPVKLMVICPCASPTDAAFNKVPVEVLEPVIQPILNGTAINADEIYVYYAVPFYPKNGKVESPFVTAFRPLLLEEIHRVNPENLLILGAQALKGLYGAKGLVNNFYGVTNAVYNDIPVYYTVDPYKLVTNPKTKLTLDVDLRSIIPCLGGAVPVWDEEQDYKKYYSVSSPEDLQNFYTAFTKAVSESRGNLFLAVDLEWGNLGGKEGIKHDIVRCVQISWKPHEAYVIWLTDSWLRPVEDSEAAKHVIKTVLERSDVEVGGHNFKVDLLHLYEMGIDCRKQFTFDTMTAFHFLKPQAAKIGLEVLAVEYTDLGRYDSSLTDYIKGAKLSGHISKHGYSRIPDAVLFPYSAKDVDAVIQAKAILEKELSEKLIAPEYSGYVVDGVPMETQLDVYNHVVKKADYGIFEAEYLGLPVDKPLMISLQRLFSEKLEVIAGQLDSIVDWDGFNPDSKMLQAYLFGSKYYTVKGQEVPDTVKTLDMVPVKTTGKYATMWEDLDEDELKTASPATDGDSLKILMGSYPEHSFVLQLILDYKSLNQVLKNFLRPPEITEDGEEVYTSGWIGKVDDDDRIRGTYLQTTETGRFRSLKPNLNNLSDAGERDVRRLFALNDDFFKPEVNWRETDTRELVKMGVLNPQYDIVRSIVRAQPGYILIGADYSQAELYTIASLSGDENMLAAMKDPDTDLHAETAIKAFGIDVPDGENRPKYIKSKHGLLRFAAKSVIFGLLYGRGPTAISRQLQAAGIDSDFNHAKKLIEDILDAYPKVREYIERQHKAVLEPGYAENPFGRRRYFFPSELGSVMASQRRESVNFPIQSTVAEVLYLAMYNLAKYKEDHKDIDYEIILPFHDAVYLHAKCNHAKRIVEEVVPECLVKNASAPSIGLELQADVETMFHWGHKVSLNDAVVESLEQLEISRKR